MRLRSYFSLDDFARSDEPLFKELGLSLDDKNQILQAMMKGPSLMQRPIVACDAQTIIARPPEKILEWLNNIFDI